MAERQTTEPAGHSVFHRGDRVRKARELAGHIDIKSFAEATGLDRGALGRYEATGDIPRRGTIKALALATGVREEWLNTGYGPMYPTDPDTDSRANGYKPGHSADILPFKTHAA